MPHAVAGGGTRSFAGEGAKINAGSLGISADATNVAHAFPLQITGGAIAVSVALPTAKTTHDVETYLGPGGNAAPAASVSGSITVGSPVNVAATSNNTATVDEFSLTLGAITVGVVEPDIEASGSTTSHVGGKFSEIGRASCRE